MIFRFEHLADDTYFPPFYAPWWGIVTEASFFDIPFVFRADKDPVLNGGPLENKEALDRMPMPDFYTSGLMPKLIEFTQVGQELLGDELQALFPTWARGPLSTAMSLRGMERLLVDMLEDPDFVHRLMRFVTDARMAWLAERTRYLGRPCQPALLFNDEIGAPLLSPRLYREFVLPYEMEIADLQGGVFYWHSCGNSTAFIKDVARLPGLRIFHVGPQTDLAMAARLLPHDVALDICLQDTRDMYDASDDAMRAKLMDIAAIAGDRHYFVRADEFVVVHTLEQDLSKMERWTDIAREVSQNR
jgi:uroporphyrinogen-III decarboxylase